MITGNTEVRNQTGLFGNQFEEGADRTEDVDFKMVTFSLAGKDYGIDIMKVAEIAKFDQFTFVPNTPPFVAGVYNLRGDIISVIDMRIMFNLPATQRKEGQPSEGLILRLEHGMIGVIVDSIAKVVGISSEAIQPPHPIFADINLKYINGVVEHEDKLYIILDVERVLGDKSEQPEKDEPVLSSVDSDQTVSTGSPTVNRDAEFIAQTLKTLRGFHLTELNRKWLEQRADELGQDGNSAQISTDGEADDFLSGFYSAYSGNFWGPDYLSDLKVILPDEMPRQINVWNPGCGRGFESYSLACMLRKVYPESMVKIWASDNDLINVSSAPNLTLEKRAVPDYYEEFLVEGESGLSFSEPIKDSILFEFSDLLHGNAVPPCDIVVIRDVLSFFSERDQKRVLDMLEDKMKADTRVIVGKGEDLLPVGSYRDVSHGTVRAFTTS